MPLDYYTLLLHDIEELGWEHIQYIDDSLQSITVRLQDNSNRFHDVSISFPPSYPRGQPVCTLSIPKERVIHWKEENSLQSVVGEVQTVLNEFDLVWKVLEDIDKNCIVIDPAKPTYQQVYRRIYLGMCDCFECICREAVLASLSGECNPSLVDWGVATDGSSLANRAL